MSSNVNSILIIGLGMIGSSIAIASKSKGINVTGFDLNDETLKKAVNEGIIDSKIESIEKINQKDVDLVILAVPPNKTLELFKSLDYLWNTTTSITDTSSVKNHFKFNVASNIVLSHPFAGSDQSGISAANGDVFMNNKNVLCDPLGITTYPVKKLSANARIAFLNETF